LKRHNYLNGGVIDSLFIITTFSLEKHYNLAYDKYLELAIGNSAWPIGVTMVGIHERSA